MCRPLFALLCLFGMLPLVQAQIPSRTVQVALNVSPEPSSYEGNIDIYVTISVPSGGPAPMGTVTFCVNDVQVWHHATGYEEYGGM